MSHAPRALSSTDLVDLVGERIILAECSADAGPSTAPAAGVPSSLLLSEIQGSQVVLTLLVANENTHVQSIKCLERARELLQHFNKDVTAPSLLVIVLQQQEIGPSSKPSYGAWTRPAAFELEAGAAMYTCTSAWQIDVEKAHATFGQVLFTMQPHAALYSCGSLSAHDVTSQLRDGILTKENKVSALPRTCFRAVADAAAPYFAIGLSESALLNARLYSGDLVLLRGLGHRDSSAPLFSVPVYANPPEVSFSGTASDTTALVSPMAMKNIGVSENGLITIGILSDEPDTATTVEIQMGGDKPEVGAAVFQHFGVDASLNASTRDRLLASLSATNISAAQETLVASMVERSQCRYIPVVSGEFINVTGTDGTQHAVYIRKTAPQHAVVIVGPDTEIHFV